LIIGRKRKEDEQQQLPGIPPDPMDEEEARKVFIICDSIDPTVTKLGKAERDLREAGRTAAADVLVNATAAIVGARDQERALAYDAEFGEKPPAEADRLDVQAQD
jgi:hypothetical protein